MHGEVGYAWQGGMHGKGHGWRGGGVRGRKDRNCSGRYTSYLNVFLLLNGFFLLFPE